MIALHRHQGRPQALFFGLLLNGWSVLVLAVLLPQAALGQAILENYTQQALANNGGYAAEQMTQQARQAQQEAAKANRLPSLSFEASYSLAAGGRTIAIPVGDLVNPINMAINDLAGSAVLPTDIPNTEEQFLPNDFHQTYLQLVVPLYLPGLQTQERIAQLEYERAAYSVQASQKRLVYEVRSAYYAYLQAQEGIAIAEAELAASQELLRVAERRLQAGELSRAEVLQARARVAQAQQALIAAQQAQTQAQHGVNLLLGNDLNEPLETDAHFLTTLPQVEATGEVSQRPELAGIAAAERIYNAQYDLARAERRPTLQLVGQAGFQGFGYRFNEDQGYALAQVSLSWTLFDGLGRSKRIRAAQAEAQALAQQQAYQEQAYAQAAQSALLAYRTAEAQLAAAGAQAEAASQAYDDLQRAYSQGAASTLQLSDALSQRTAALQNQVLVQLSLWQAYDTYRYQTAQL